MAEGSVSERRIHPIQDAAASGNWKQALQLCDKWSKKGEKSDQFLALKATVLLKQSDNTQRERGKQELVQLCSRDPAITNIDALQQIQDALRDLSLHTQEGPKLWERAIAKNPQNLELLTTWLRSSIAESNWLGAQKAAVALRKAFPKERKYEFWKTLFSYLIQQDPSLEKNQRKLFGTLAYRFISKAAETVPEDKDQLLSSPEALQSPDELDLLVNIYINTDRAAEAVKVLSSNSLGLSSRFATEDPALVLRLLVISYIRAELWNDAFDFCESRFDITGNLDATLWELMLTALRESQRKEELVQRAQLMASKAIAMSPNARTGYVAALSMMQANGMPGLKLVDACQQYYEKFKTKAFCFEDLRKPVSLLGQHETNVLFEIIAKDEGAQNSDQNLLSLKMRYCFRLGPDAKLEELDHFAGTALELYDTCRKNSKACPEASFLAAVVLVKIARSHDQSHEAGKASYCEALLQAAMLLESCQQDQKHGEEYYPLLILLIRVQQMLGLLSMAMINFKKLSVKNIQFESVGYLVLNRISTLHPCQYGKITPESDNGYSPLEQLDLALEMLEKSEMSLTRQIDTGLEHGSYTNITQAIEMRSKLQRSINREVFAYEHLKTRRLTGLFDEGGHSVPGYPLVDQRDFSFLQTYEISGQSTLQHLELGPLPKERWLNTMGLYDKLFFYLRSETQGQPGSVEKALAQVKIALEILEKSSHGESSLELTVEEAENFLIHKTIARLIIFPGDPMTSKESHITESIDEIETWLRLKSTEPQQGCVAIRSIVAPTWKYLHASFTSLETIQGISLFLSAVSKKSSRVSKALSIRTETILKLRSLITEAEAAIHKQAKDIKVALNDAGVLGNLVDIVTGRSEDGERQSDVGQAIENLGDAARLETYCGEMKESWEDALNGVLGCKIKTF